MIQHRRHAGWATAFVALVLLPGWLGHCFAQVKDLPPKPSQYITDQAGVLDAGTLASINSELDQFERDTSNQLVVAIYPSLPPDSDIAQYATYTYNAWGIGQKGKDNGVLLLVAVNDHKLFIAPGRGLEGALPDAICKNIVTRVITPHFKQRDFAGGIQAGVDAIIAATKGEYKGTGSTDDDSSGSDQGIPTWLFIVIFIILVIITSRSRSSRFGGPVVFTGGGGGWGGGGGGYSGGGGGGFSGGGGSSSGGGAGGSW